MKQKIVARQIKAELTEAPQGKTTQELSQALGFDHGEDFADFVKLIAHLEATGQIEISAQGKIRLPMTNQVVTGHFSQNDKGFGFVSVENYDDDIFIPKQATGNALNGDTVEVTISQAKQEGSDKSAEGEITAIIERHTSRVIGEFTAFDDHLRAETGFYGGIKAQNKGFDRIDIFVKEDGLHPVTGEIVALDIDDYPSSDHPHRVTGQVVKQLGHKDEPGVDILAILNLFDIPVEFPEAVKKQADQVPESISDQDLSGRLDLRDLLTITIDGADAKDLDDAISMEKLSNGNQRLGVHIADVSHYVTKNSPIDQEAFERGTSVYLTDRVVPMLPQRLSNGICSLHPNVDRLTLSCLMEVNQQGVVVDYQIQPSIINSDYRMTYSAVNDMLEDHNANQIDHYQAIYPMLLAMQDLHFKLYDRREARGAINFDTPESEIEVDRDGKPLAIHLRERGVGEMMIESFMLLANETVAKHFTQKSLPFIYRIHEHPDADRLQRFLEFVTNFGLFIKGTKDDMKPKNLQKILHEVEDETFGPVVKMMLLRSMQQAKYAVTPIGHYGLAAEDYTHFTSPIRRYPDLIVHRLIHTYAKKKPNKDQAARLTLDLEEIADQSSKMERRSIEAERETDSLKKTEFMLDKVGMTFTGIVSSVTGFGFFVELDNTVEGLVHISTLDDDYYHYVARQLVLIGEHTGNTYKIGDRVQVKLVKTDLDSREIDFEIVPDKNANKNKGKFGKRNTAHKVGKHGKKLGKGQTKGQFKGKNAKGKNKAKSHNRKNNSNSKGKGRNKGKNQKKAFKIRRKRK
ncbi:ribonuclease R [Aerococcus kribbianus]|uniref:Ribonuclease R n=1 Tax=Aerococcus kribbianus TaxID=2999064 RepID=A0A9X3FLX5_9LACT|nr:MULTISPECIES: ribonuclease R [unclassified Aerococcus]MCZ0716952.1 ribonuclease R [Aerococcus sp. YH-aer221]MCZ0725240.1 ribonuclease R [Aerococcus sp. YH-aer222]